MSYLASQVPTDPVAIPDFLRDELQKLQRALNGTQAFMNLKLTTVAPTKYRDGDIYYADGSSWKPSGSTTRGVYVYKSSVPGWVLLG